METNMNYSSAEELIADFEAGAKFEVRGECRDTGSVKSITRYVHGNDIDGVSEDIVSVYVKDISSWWFDIKGNRGDGAYLVKTANAPSKQADPDFSLQGFADGQSAWTKDGDFILQSFTVFSGAIRVTLIQRDHPRGEKSSLGGYRVDGSNPQNPSLSLTHKKPGPRVSTIHVVTTRDESGDFRNHLNFESVAVGSFYSGYEVIACTPVEVPA